MNWEINNILYQEMYFPFNLYYTILLPVVGDIIL